MRELYARATVERSARLLFGGPVGIQVWHIRAPSRFYASVLTGSGSPIVMLSDRLVGSDQEMETMNWALAVIARGCNGYTALVAAD